MGFQDIMPLERAQVLLDIAFRRALKAKDKNERKRELAKISIVSQNLSERLDSYWKSFPHLDNLSEFYSELVKVTLDRDRLKKSLSNLHWASSSIKKLAKSHSARLVQDPAMVRKAFMGRASSIVRQVDKDLEYLEGVRRVFKDYPVIKELPTVCIAGFPNVGKSTLLSKLTTSKPEIASYAFTTRRLNIGYLRSGDHKVQLIDTPGTLARPEKMNNIERQAYLAIKYQAELVVFVFDLTDTYPLEDQERLLKLVAKYKKPIVVYLSKTDLLTGFEEFAKKMEAFTSAEDLKEEIIKRVA